MKLCLYLSVLAPITQNDVRLLFVIEAKTLHQSKGIYRENPNIHDASRKYGILLSFSAILGDNFHSKNNLVSSLWRNPVNGKRFISLKKWIIYVLLNLLKRNWIVCHLNLAHVLNKRHDSRKCKSEMNYGYCKCIFYIICWNNIFSSFCYVYYWIRDNVVDIHKLFVCLCDSWLSAGYVHVRLSPSPSVYFRKCGVFPCFYSLASLFIILVCVCVCVCVWGGGVYLLISLCVCVCVCVWGGGSIYCMGTSCSG